MTANSCKVKQSLPMGMVVEHQGNSTRVLSWVGKPTFSAGAVVIIAFHGDGLPFFFGFVLVQFADSIPFLTLDSIQEFTFEDFLDLMGAESRP